MPPKKNRGRARVARAPTSGDREKSEFLAVLGHELRTPLALLRHAASVFRDPEADVATQRDAREMLGRQVARMTRLVDDLLDVARILRGELDLRPAPVELSAPILQAVEDVRRELESRRQRLGIELPKDAVGLDADAARMRQVFAHLLDNASKFSPDGSEIRIRAAAASRQDEIAVRVEDDGTGIAGERLPGLFEFFAAASGSGNAAPSGLGFGLALAKRIVELHGGTIEAESAGPGRGSTIIVRLPVLSRHPAPAVGSRDARPAARSISRRILVVDDNVDGAQTLGMLLRAVGHEVHVAYSGHDGLEAAPVFRPEVVLLDLGLPGIDGFEVAQRLRGQPGMVGVLLVAISGYDRDEDRRRTSEAGFDHHLVKPTDLDTLKRILETSPART